MATDEKRLLNETIALAEMLATAESMAGKALEQVATLRRHHRARLVEWQKARGPASILPAPDSVTNRVPPSLIDDGDGNTAADAATERHGVVASALRTAEANRDTPRVEGVPLESTEINGVDQRPGRGARIEGAEDDD